MDRAQASADLDGQRSNRTCAADSIAWRNVCERSLERTPKRHLFVFRSRRGDRLKILCGTGTAPTLYKRLEAGFSNTASGAGRAIGGIARQ